MADRHWLRPPVVLAPGPYDRGKLVRFGISRSMFMTLVTARRVSPIYWAWAHVVGELPPINNISRLLQVDVVP